MTESFLRQKRIWQGDGLFMNDLPEYFRAHNCAGVMLGNQSLNYLMLMLMIC